MAGSFSDCAVKACIMIDEWAILRVPSERVLQCLGVFSGKGEGFLIPTSLMGVIDASSSEKLTMRITNNPATIPMHYSEKICSLLL